MKSIVLILVFLWGGEIQFAVFNNGNTSGKPHEFKTMGACMKEAEKQTLDIKNILDKDATFIEFKCVTRDKMGQV